MMANDLSHLTLWERLVIAKKQLDPVYSDYRVVFETDLDAPASILVPDPNWMACALAGGILPPVKVYHDLQVNEEGHIINGHILHETPPIGPMSEEEAIEYLIQKDIPASVWQTDDGSNARKFIVCKSTQLPGSRDFRNAWSVQQENIT